MHNRAAFVKEQLINNRLIYEGNGGEIVLLGTSMVETILFNYSGRNG